MFQVWITRDFVFNVDMVLEGWMDLRFLGWNPGVDGRWVMSEMSYFYEEKRMSQKITVFENQPKCRI